MPVTPLAKLFEELSIVPIQTQRIFNTDYTQRQAVYSGIGKRLVERGYGDLAMELAPACMMASEMRVEFRGAVGRQIRRRIRSRCPGAQRWIRAPLRLLGKVRSDIHIDAVTVGSADRIRK